MLWLLVVYVIVVLLAMAWGIIVGVRFRGTLPPVSYIPESPRVSTIVPARNEECNIGRCIAGLSHQTYPDLEMIFVDDQSTDATPEIIASHAKSDPRIVAVCTEERPDGWNGKQWACYSGAQAATGDWLCFMDADTYAEPDLITRTAAFATMRGVDMLTLQPWYEMRGMWERVVLPASLIPLLLFYPPHLVNDPETDMVIANGQFILVRRDVYEAIGGHAAVKDRMMDDFSLAETIKQAGYQLFIADGSEVMRVRMYTGLREIRAGAMKASVELTGGWVKSVIGLTINIALNILPALMLIIAIAQGRTPAIQILSAVVVIQVIYYAMLRMLAFRAPPWSAITYPLGSLIASTIVFEGMVRVAIGSDIRWKGRSLVGVPTLRTPRTD